MDKTRQFDKKLAAHLIRCQKAFASKSKCMISWISECKNRPINSHLISKSALSTIAEKGHLINYQYDLFKLEEQTDPIFKSVGIGKASTFKGFCSKHDSELFSKLDNNEFNLDEQLAAVLSLRGIAHEVWQKRAAHNQLSSYDLVDENFQSDEFQARFMNSLSLGASHFLIHYNNTVRDIIEKTSTKWKYVEFISPFSLPFCYTGPINLDAFIQYNQLEPDARFIYPVVTVSVIPRRSGTSISLTWSGALTPAMKVFFKRFESAGKHLPELLLQIGLEHVEKIYFKPSWFESITDCYRKPMTELTHQNTLATQYNWISINKRPLSNIFPPTDLRQWRIRTNSIHGKRVIEKLRS